MASEAVQFLKFSGLAKPVMLVGCGDLVARFPRVFADWPFREIPNCGNRPVLSLSRTGRGYCLDGFWMRDPVTHEDEVEALNALVLELLRACVHQDERLVCLRGASALFGDKLVVFPRVPDGGRRIVAACLAASGIRLFGDDVLPMNRIDGKGMAMGLAPSLNLPLPQQLSAGLRTFIERHVGLHGEHRLYLELDDRTLVRRGFKAPVGGFVLLEHKPGQPPKLEAVPESEVLKQLVSQNLTGEAESPRIWQMLGGLVAHAQRYRLSYGHAEEAAELLIAHFGPRPAPASRRSRATPIVAGLPMSLLPGYYLRKPEISVIEVSGQLFLADRNGAAIRPLNQVGNAIWSLLEEPKSVAEISDLLVTAFPDLNLSQVEIDVRGLISELLASDLLNQGADAHRADVTIN